MNGTSHHLNGDGPPLLGEDSPHHKIEAFLQREMERGTLVRVELSQVGLHGDSKVGDWNAFEGIGPEHITLSILERAMDDAKMQKGSPRYVVSVFRTHDRKYDGRVWFTLAGGGHEFDGIEEMEGPNATGIVAQLMRHTEASARLSLMSARDIIVEQRREIAEQRAFIRQAMQMQFKLVDTYEKLKNEQHTRDLAIRKERFEEVKQEQIFGQIMMLLPIFFRFLGGDKSDMVRLTAMEHQIRSLFGSIPEKTLLEFMAKLDPTQQLSLMDLNKLISSPPTSPAEAIAQKEKREKDQREAEEKRRLEAEKDAAKNHGSG